MPTHRLDHLDQNANRSSTSFSERDRFSFLLSSAKRTWPSERALAAKAASPSKEATFASLNLARVISTVKTGLLENISRAWSRYFLGLLLVHVEAGPKSHS